ncbi:uncharacterized protein LOC128201781 [Galleria mellonella]|uniref:Uncharacterized protein LOC128201781 n=1 Tax=Galleria mellonella TaxID=7137 RepID=A0ABM3MWE5_GALME|nr:uncharacterized protein LOC128201781 [Galleria mellonella]
MENKINKKKSNDVVSEDVVAVMSAKDRMDSVPGSSGVTKKTPKSLALTDRGSRRASPVALPTEAEDPAERESAGSAMSMRSAECGFDSSLSRSSSRSTIIGDGYTGMLVDKTITEQLASARKRHFSGSDSSGSTGIKKQIKIKLQDAKGKNKPQNQRAGPAPATSRNRVLESDSNDERASSSRERNRVTTRSKSSTMGQPVRNNVTEEIIQRARTEVHGRAGTVLDVIRKSRNLKGTCQKVMKEEILAITQVVDQLQSDFNPQSVTPLLSRNLSLEKEVESLKNQLAELRAAQPAPEAERETFVAPKNRAPRTASRAAPCTTPQAAISGEDLEIFREQVMKDVSRMIQKEMRAMFLEFMGQPAIISAAHSPALQGKQEASLRPQWRPPLQGDEMYETLTRLPGAGGPDFRNAPQFQAPPPNSSGRNSRFKPTDNQIAYMPSPAIPSTSRAPADTWATVVRRGGKTLAVPQNQGQPQAGKTSKKGKAQSAPKSDKKGPPSPSKLRAPRSSAVIISLQPEAEARGVDYAKVLQEARSKLDLANFGIETIKFRTAATGARVLQVPGVTSSDKADALANRLRELIPGDVAKVSRPTKMAEMRVMGLDDSITSSELAAAIARDGECPLDVVKVGDIKRNSSGLGTCWVRAPVLAVKKITSAGRILVGWVAARTELLRQRPLRCYKCLQSGHVRSRCLHEEDRSGLCYRCGRPGHKAASCSAAPNCAVCAP